MNCEEKGCCMDFSYEETEEGYAIQIKGDKTKIKAKIEAMEAFFNFTQKAKAACGNEDGQGHANGMFAMFHKHIQAMQKHGGHHGHHGHEGGHQGHHGDCCGDKAPETNTDK